MRIVEHFTAPRDLERAGDAAERAGWRVVGACAPAYNEAVVDTAHATTSPVANAAVGGALVGIASGVLLTVGTTLEWPARIIGGKPLIAVPPLLLIVFELAVLGASIAAVCSFVAASVAARRAGRAACDVSTSDNQLSLLLESDTAHAAALDDLLRQTTPVSWRSVRE